MSENEGRGNIPWQKKLEWQQVFESIQRVDAPGEPAFDHLRTMAKQIRSHFDQISGLIDQVCLNTCGDCTDICCIRATIWFDFKDLLYIYFGLDSFPQKQIIKDRSHPLNACSCLKETGCMLSRLERPFVCTWYFCPEQKRLLAANEREKQTIIDDHLSKIKQLRQRIEDEFIIAALRFRTL